MSPSDQPPWNDDRTNSNRGVLLALGTLTGITVVTGIALFAISTYAPPQTFDAPQEVAEVGVPESLEALPEDPEAPDPMALASAAQEKVERLQGELDQATESIEQYEADRAKGAEQAASARERWKMMEQEVARLQVALSEAESERDSLRRDLARTLDLLDEQIALTAKVRQEREIWKGASTDNLWAAFVQSTKVNLCDRGNRKSLSKCHAAVAQVMDTEARGRFDHCVSAARTLPALVEVDRRQEAPAFSEPFPSGTRQIGKDWHVVYCDPSLPEAPQLANYELPEPTVIRLASN